MKLTIVRIQCSMQLRKKNVFFVCSNAQLANWWMSIIGRSLVKIIASFCVYFIYLPRLVRYPVRRWTSRESASRGDIYLHFHWPHILCSVHLSRRIILVNRPKTYPHHLHHHNIPVAKKANEIFVGFILRKWILWDKWEGCQGWSRSDRTNTIHNIHKFESKTMLSPQFLWRYLTSALLTWNIWCLCL